MKLSKELMQKAHKLTKEIKAEYQEIDYKVQLGLCISYLLEENEEELSMIRWEREDGKVFEFTVDKQIHIYRDGEHVGSTEYFHTLEEGESKIIEFYYPKAKKYFKLKMENEEVNKQILRVKDNNIKEIDNFFSSIVKHNFEEHHGHFYIEENDKVIELKEKDEYYYNKRLREFIEENRRYMIKTGEKIELYSEGESCYTFDIDAKKEKLKEEETYKQTEEYKEKVKRNERLNELCEMAENMTDKEFEETTGLLRENYLI